MRNNSQKAECMRRSPASHCCHVRQVVCTSAPASVCDKPAASRAARMSAGAGFEEGPFGPRFGWLPISEERAEVPEALDAAFRANAHKLKRAVCAEADCIDELGTTLGRHVLARGGDCLAERAQLGAIGRRRDLGEMRNVEEVTERRGGGGKSEHLRLQPLVTRGAVAAQNALHETNNTRIARNCNKNIFIGWRHGAYGDKPSNIALIHLRAPRQLGLGDGVRVVVAHEAHQVFRKEIALYRKSCAQLDGKKNGICALTTLAYIPRVVSMTDLLHFVRDSLTRSMGDLPKVSRATGIPYDTVLRIKNGEGDPGYSKVQRLAEYFEQQKAA